MTSILDNNDNHFLLPIYKVYPDLGVINPWLAVKTQEVEENYYKSLLYGCKECDRIEPSLQFMLYHRCTKNGKSKYKQHQQEALDRRKKIKGIGKW
jgi:hypothetical protein